MANQESTLPGASREGSGVSTFDAFAQSVVTNMERLSKIAQTGVSSFLLALGTAILLLGLFCRLRPGGVQISDLTPIEFIALIALCAVLLVAGAYLRFYQYQQEREVSRTLTTAGTEIIQKTAETAARLQEATLNKGGELIVPRPPTNPI